ncbi:hypothetical protein PILCRDRAFT_823873 [Piloderma croceum F 1598]|uniref:Uncharacterized protein n=1 Tax=Piloderma croceum (strain F 1598) TaxID=765440 RepID=A0A0C3FGP1_PILCF|nr:hypothetical protein PILCRDRAFT_823873 [Piloderma croceum F 1598]
MGVTIQRDDASDICSICYEFLTNTRVFASSVSQGVETVKDITIKNRSREWTAICQ